mmetsp:Transcript_20260/g.44242  ORF Transcript_20260/g.44242 Transcript_20260/m.44242 type:complete len:285 (-) Transcript_20260:145-999(-)
MEGRGIHTLGVSTWQRRIPFVAEVSRTRHHSQVLADRHVNRAGSFDQLCIGTLDVAASIRPVSPGDAACGLLAPLLAPFPIQHESPLEPLHVSRLVSVASDSFARRRCFACGIQLSFLEAETVGLGASRAGGDKSGRRLLDFRTIHKGEVLARGRVHTALLREEKGRFASAGGIPLAAALHLVSDALGEEAASLSTVPALASVSFIGQCFLCNAGLEGPRIVRVSVSAQTRAIADEFKGRQGLPGWNDGHRQDQGWVKPGTVAVTSTMESHVAVGTDWFCERRE